MSIAVRMNGGVGPGPMLAVLAVLTLGAGLGGARRLSYHEAIVAQGAREMIAPEGDWLEPTIGGSPWLEKPPLAHWLAAACGRAAGEVDEFVARLPSAIAAVALAWVVGALASRRFGPTVGLLSAAVQLTTSWTIARGRLAEADILLALLVAATLSAFDRLRGPGDRGSTRIDRTRWAFFALLGASSLAKGVGFGAALALASIAAALLWDRDRRTLRVLLWPTGWLLSALIALAWPLAISTKYPGVLALWTTHITDRLSTAPSHFAGESIGSFLLAPFFLTLPWTPLAIVGARHSLRRARQNPGGPDRLLWAWAVIPTALLSMATVRNDHYLIHALPPWSIWAALGLSRLGERLHLRRGWTPRRLRTASITLFGTLGLAVAIAHVAVIPRLDDRGLEWSWYAEAAALADPTEPLVLLYDWDGPDPWDRLPYPTPFGLVPHDHAVRLFYLNRPATWINGPSRLADSSPTSSPFSVIARPRDLPALRRLGPVEEIARGPAHRWDRAYVLFRVSSVERTAVRWDEVATRERSHRGG